MTRQVLYVAAPLRPTEGEIAAQPTHRVEVRRGEYEPDLHLPFRDVERVALAIRANLDRAMAWLSWLRRSFPETTFIAPWIASVLAGADDTDPAQREAGFTDDCAVIERCDGIVLCGPRVSDGMRREMEHGVAVSGQWADGACRFAVYDLTALGANPPVKIASGSPEHRVIAGLLLRDLQSEAGL